MRTQHSASFSSVQVLIKLVTQDLPAPWTAGLGHKCSLNAVHGFSQVLFFRKTSGRYTCGRGLSLGQYIAAMQALVNTSTPERRVCPLSFQNSEAGTLNSRAQILHVKTQPQGPQCKAGPGAMELYLRTKRDAGPKAQSLRPWLLF